MKTLCFIPARGGSKRIPRKNLLPLAGRPLLFYTTAAARSSGLFSRIVVSSDDDEILALAASLGVEADRRPASLGGDQVRFVEVLEEFLLRSPSEFDTVAVLLPTCPFRSVEDLQAAARLLAAAPEPSFVVSLSRYDFPPEFAVDFDGTNVRLRAPEAYAASTQSQSVAPSYHPNGAIYLAPVPLFLIHRAFYAAPLLGYLMPPERSLDLDYPHQFPLAEALLRSAELTSPSTP